MRQRILLSLALVGCGTSDRRVPDASPAIDASAIADSSAADDSALGLPGQARLGDPCRVDSDCIDPPDATCFTEVRNPFDGTVVASYPGGFCSRGCSESEECGANERAACVSEGGSNGVSSMTCTLSCTTNADCRQSEGYRCEMFFGFGFCAP